MYFAVSNWFMKSLMKIRKRCGPRTEPCGIPQFTGIKSELLMEANCL